MEISVNGEKKEVKDEISVAELLTELNISDEGIIILLNEQIIPKDEYNLKIYQNYEIEILRFVSGG